jgi:hypothetical protein
MKKMNYSIAILFLMILAAGYVRSQENKPPKFFYSPHSIILGKGGIYSDYIHVTDANLFIKNVFEELTFKSINQDSIIFDPAIIKGPFVDNAGNPDADTLRQVLLKCSDVDWLHDENYIATVKLLVTDKAGLWDQVSFPVRIHEPVKWKVKMLVQNPKITKFELIFGQAVNATTGQGNDGAPEGKLDIMYAETELTPVDSIKGFDARWTISKTNGTLWNIQPFPGNNIQFNGTTIDLTSSSPKDTVTFKWYIYDIPDPTDYVKNPNNLSWYICDGETGGAKFKYDMRTLKAIVNSPSISEIANNNNIGELTTFAYGYKFIIKGEKPGNDVAEEAKNRKIKISPNPASDIIMINIENCELPNEIIVFDQLGRKMPVASNEKLSINANSIQFNIENLNSGIYYLNLKYRNHNEQSIFIKY